MSGTFSGESAERTQRLAAALRAAASRAAEIGEGGVALVFATGSGSPIDLRLRAASGFATADDAREAATSLLPQVREALSSEEPRQTDGEALGERARGGLWILPMREGESVHGALLVGAPSEFTPAMHEVAGQVCESLSLRLDHDRLAAEAEALRTQAIAGSTEGFGEDKSEEVLKLSEALFAQDIELLRSNEKLGKIERLKNDYIEKMSRELRTPLNSNIETIISVMTTENDGISESSKAAMRTALDEGTSFLRTLQNILDLWKIKQGELPVEIQDVNFRELVDEAIFSIQDGLGDKDLRIEPNLAEPFPRVRTDLAKVSQILFLLLDNAAKFTSSGEIEITGGIEEGRLVCSVRDTGVGICPDDQQFVFDEFFQVDEPSSQKYRGAGLGLTLVRDLVVLLEGEVMISSDVGRGTTVTFSVPVQSA
ncbi:MAG: sensor histidine kinase [Myxococcota bacterium]